MMGLEKYFAGMFMILVCLIAFSSFFNDAMISSQKTTNTQYDQYLNDTTKYYSGLSNQTESTKTAIEASGLKGSSSGDLFSMFSLLGQSVAITITTTIKSLGIFYALTGILTIIMPVAAIFIGLGVSWIVLSWLLSLLKGIRMGDTSG